MKIIKDIAAEMRNLAQGYKESNDKIPRRHIGIMITRYADKIEQVVTKCNQPEPVTNCNSLNAAKMREALEKMRDFMDAMNSSQEPIEYGEYSWAVDTIDDALSAPPRNCDRFGSWREANAEWWKYEVLPRVEGVVSGTEQPFEEWLFAKAKESLNK